MGLKIKSASHRAFLMGALSLSQLLHWQASDLGVNPVLSGWEVRGPKINKSSGESDQH